MIYQVYQACITLMYFVQTNIQEFPNFISPCMLLPSSICVQKGYLVIDLVDGLN